jgi:hypothetical protein
MELMEGMGATLLGPAERSAGLDTANFWTSDRVYHLGFPIKAAVKGDAKGDGGRSALDGAVTQVLRGTNGLIDLLAGEPTLLRPTRGGGATGCVIPVVFTTAKLWISEVELAKSDLASGKVPEALLQPIPWLWLKQNTSPDLKHSLAEDPPERSTLDDLGNYARWHFSRCVAVVSVEGVEAFLSQGHWGVL